MSTNTGIKHDENKPDLSILNLNSLEQIAQAFSYGEKKYGRYNYLGGMRWTRISSALLRHMYKWIWGANKDDESKLSHLAHVGACVFMLIDYSQRGLGTDDRYVPETSDKTSIPASLRMDIEQMDTIQKEREDRDNCCDELSFWQCPTCYGIR